MDQTSKSPLPMTTPSPENVRFYLFWQQLLNRANAQGISYLAGKSAARHSWLYCSAGIPNYRFIFGVWADGRTEVQFEIRGKRKEDNKVLFDHLYTVKNAIEDRFGAPVEWDRREKMLASYVHWITGSNLDLYLERDWGPIQDEMLAAMTRFISALEPELNEMIADWR